MVFNSLTVAFLTFLLIRGINRFERNEEATLPATPTTMPCPHCRSSIPTKATRCAFCTATLEPA